MPAAAFSKSPRATVSSFPDLKKQQQEMMEKEMEEEEGGGEGRKWQNVSLNFIGLN